MLTDLSWLDMGKPFPPPAEKARLDTYKENEQLFLSKHDEAWKKAFEDLSRKNWRKDVRVETILNYHQLLSKKMADFVCGDAPVIETGGDTDALMKALGADSFWAKLYEAMIDVSRYGNGVMKFVKSGVSGVSPLCWFPIVDPTDVKAITQHVLAYPINQGEQLYVEIHTVGTVEQRYYAYSDKGEIGKLERFTKPISTGLDVFAVQVFSNLTHSGSIYGVDDYGIINSLLKKIMWRLYCADSILDKHSEPSMSGPESALELDKRTNRYILHTGNYFVRSDKEDPDVQYITWDGNLSSNFQELEFLINQLYILTEMGQAFADAGGTEASSGTALKLRMISPRIKAQRIVSINDATVKVVIAQLAKIKMIEIGSDITLHWNDGLPEDEVEQIGMLSQATGGKPIMSQYAALKKRGLSDAEVQAELTQIAEEDMASLPAIDTGREGEEVDEE